MRSAYWLKVRNSLLCLGLAALYIWSLGYLYESGLHLGIGHHLLGAQVHASWMREAVPWLLACASAVVLSRMVASFIQSSVRAISLLSILSLGASVWLTFQPLAYSMDVLRYLWDGHLLVHGVSPYAYTPNDAHLQVFRDWSYWKSLDWKNWPEAYPPLAQLYFWLAAAVTNGSVEGFKLLVLLNGWVANGLFLMVLRARRRANAGTAAPGSHRCALPPLAGAHGWTDADTMAFGWFVLLPPILVESYGAGHVDAFAIPWLLWAWLAALRKDPWQLGFAIAMATTIKLYPVVLFAALWERGRYRSIAKSLAGFVLGLTCVYLPFIGRPAGLLSFFSHVSQLDYNGSLEYMLVKLFGSTVDARSTLLVFVVELAAWAAIWWTKANRLSLEQRASLLGLTFFLASPLLHPWYLLSILPFAIVALDFATLWLAFAVHLTYDEVFADMYIEYIPTYVFYVWQWTVGRGISGRRPDSREEEPRCTCRSTLK